MKKFLPIILLVIGLVVVGVAFFFVRRARQGGDEEIDDESALIEVSLEKRPVASLTPSEDGHYIFMRIIKLMVEGAETLDYELLYKVQDGGTQGVPGTIKLKGQSEIERELLLGSESSGKYRYDEGVEQGTLTLRFRNERGKLMAKFSTDFHLQSQTSDLSTVDGTFEATRVNKIKGGYYISMETFGYPGKFGGNIVGGPYGVFSSSDSSEPLKINAANVHHFSNDKWEKLSDSTSDDDGFFVLTSE